LLPAVLAPAAAFAQRVDFDRGGGSLPSYRPRIGGSRPSDASPPSDTRDGGRSSSDSGSGASRSDSGSYWEESDYSKHVARYNGGLAHFRAQRWVQALSEFNAALQYEPGDPPTRLMIGVTLLHLDRLREALAVFEKLVGQFPDNVQYAHYLAWTYARMADVAGRDDPSYLSLLEQCRQALRACLKLRHDHPEAYTMLGDVHYALGDKLLSLGRSVEAEAAFRDAIRNRPAGFGGWGHGLLGTIYVDRGLPDQAIKYFRTALRRNPGDASLHFHLAYAQLSAGQYQEAVPVLQEVLRLKPDFAAARRNLDYVATARSRTEALQRMAEGEQYKPRPLTDGDGKPVLDRKGNPVLETYCNRFVADGARQYGYSGFAGRRADDILAHVRSGAGRTEGWKPVLDPAPTVDYGPYRSYQSVQERLGLAQRLANQGRLVVVGAAEPGGHGHVALVVPGSLEKSGDWAMMVPRIAQAGRHVSAGERLSLGFGADARGRLVAYVWEP
jgi:tetratricopeptide (TPR) repeat protein